MNYTIRITETLSRDITVKADSLEEALEQLEADYASCNIVLSADDWVDTQVDIVKQ